MGTRKVGELAGCVGVAAAATLGLDCDGEGPVDFEAFEGIELGEKAATSYEGGDLVSEGGSGGRREENTVVDHAVFEEGALVAKQSGNTGVGPVNVVVSETGEKGSSIRQKVPMGTVSQDIKA